MGKKFFKPPTMESIISADHARHSFSSSSKYNQKGLLMGKCGKDLYSSLLKFDLSSLPFTLAIVKSTLNLTLFTDEYPTKKVVEALQILSRWQQEKVCWEERPLTSSSATAIAVIDSPPGTLISFDLTALVASWYTGQSANLGVLLKMSDECTDNLISCASGRFVDERVWPYLEVDFISPCSEGGHDAMDITHDVTPSIIPKFTSPVNTLLFNYTYLVKNNGLNAATVHLEVSPDGSVWQTQSEVAKINPGQLVTLVPDTIAKFSRLSYQLVQPGKNTALTVYIQGVC